MRFELFVLPRLAQLKHHLAIGILIGVYVLVSLSDSMGRLKPCLQASAYCKNVCHSLFLVATLLRTVSVM